MILLYHTILNVNIEELRRKEVSVILFSLLEKKNICKIKTHEQERS